MLGFGLGLQKIKALFASIIGIVDFLKDPLKYLFDKPALIGKLA